MDNRLLKLLIQGGSMASMAGGPVAGAIGTGAGGLISAGIDLFNNKSSYPGPSADEEQALFFAGETASQASQLSGASASEVSRLVQGNNEQGNKETQDFNTMFRQLSPFDMAKISGQIMTRASEIRDQTSEGVSKFLQGSEARNLLTSVQATRSYAGIADRVQQKKLQAQLLKEETDAKMNADFSNMLMNITRAMSSPILDFGGGVDTGDGINVTQPLNDPKREMQTPPVPSMGEDDLRSALAKAGYSEEQIAYYLDPNRTPGYAQSIVPLI